MRLRTLPFITSALFLANSSFSIAAPGETAGIIDGPGNQITFNVGRGSKIFGEDTAELLQAAAALPADFAKLMGPDQVIVRVQSVVLPSDPKSNTAEVDLRFKAVTVSRRKLPRDYAETDRLLDFTVWTFDRRVVCDRIDIYHCHSTYQSRGLSKMNLNFRALTRDMEIL